MEIKTSKLNLGCGKNILDGYVNVDFGSNCTPDIRHDLNIFPYPFPDDSFDEILVEHAIEHLDEPLNVMQEIYRIAKNDASITVKCPHFSCNWIHPGHKSPISTKLFDFLNQENSESYGNTDFKVEEIRLRWMRNTELGKRKKVVIKILNAVINKIANINPAFTERIWCYWVGGFEELAFRVIVRKGSGGGNV